MITSSEEALRHEGGPIEKTHLKDMVQRNALESLVFSKITKHIETEKKAFTRQNSRDETEMKHLLLRLHHHQQTTLLGDDKSSGKISSLQRHLVFSEVDIWRKMFILMTKSAL